MAFSVLMSGRDTPSCGHKNLSPYIELGNDMLAIPLYILFAGVTVWGFFEPMVAGWVYFGTAALFCTWLFLTSWSLRSKWIRNLNEDALSMAEVDIFRTYAFYFIFPFQAKQYSSTCSLIQALCIVWFGLALWHREWGFLACIVVLFFFATNLMPRLNQGNFLRHHNKRGKLSPELQARLAIVEAVESKILEARPKQWHE
jgi:hypothetical protein